MSVLLYLLFLIIGACGGFFYAKKQVPDYRIKELEDLLQDVQGRHERYQRNVSNHFEQTASLVNELTQRYRDVHEHLVNGASELCDDPKRHRDENPAKQFISLGANPVSYQPPYSVIDEPEYSEYTPPRDYATKSPSEKGTLDERFGFK